MNENKGKKVEELVYGICDRMFLKDFVISSPDYKDKKEKNLMKEAADIIVPFRNNLLVYQVKSKIEAKKFSEKTRVDFVRILKRVEKAIAQFRTIKLALENDSILTVKNRLGISIPFDPKKFKKIIGIVVLDLLGEELFHEDERTAIYNGFLDKYEIPIHIFLREELEAIASEIDTLPDFIEYLDLREELRRNENLYRLTSEKDYLAFYKHHPNLLKEVQSEKPNLIIVEEGTCVDYKKNKEFSKNQNKQKDPSLLIDEIIKYWNSSIGFFPDFEHLIGRNDIQQGSIESYFTFASELASLNRQERCSVGKAFLYSIKQADKRENGSYSLLKLSGGNTGILVFSTKKPREQRIVAIKNLANIVYCKFKFKKLLGIATENASAKTRTYDGILLENVVIENCDEILEKNKEVFSKNNRVTKTINLQKKKNKIGRNDLCFCGSGKKFKKCCLK